MGGLNLTAQSLPNIAWAIFAGLIPSILWLMFWRREDKSHPEPLGLVILVFIAGMLSVIFVLPLEKLISTFPVDSTQMTVLWAASEEILKCLAFFVVMIGNPHLDSPMDYAIYFIAAGLGFAALENSLFIIHPVVAHDTVVSFITGNLRFLGSTLLHATTSALIGLGTGLAFFKSKSVRFFYGFFGLLMAIALHSTFNFFIMKNDGENFLQVFGFLWVVTIIIMLIFEKLRRMESYVNYPPANSNFSQNYK